MKIWLFLESLNPLKWGVRYGKKWKLVDSVKIKTSMKTKSGKNAPHCYLEGRGHIEFTKGMAIIHG